MKHYVGNPRFSKVFLLVVTFGLFHGLVFLPVLLCLVRTNFKWKMSIYSHLAFSQWGFVSRNIFMHFHCIYGVLSLHLLATNLPNGRYSPNSVGNLPCCPNRIHLARSLFRWMQHWTMLSFSLDSSDTGNLSASDKVIFFLFIGGV